MEYDNDNTTFARYQAGDKTALQDIFKQYEPLINSTVMQYKDTGIDPEALSMETKRIIMRSMKTFDPVKGNLTSHIQNNLKSMFRETNKASKLYIPDSRAVLYRKYKDAYANMNTDLKRPPTDLEMADHLKIGVKDIRRLSKETNINIVPDTDMYESDYDQAHVESPDEFIKKIRAQLRDPIDVKILDDSMVGEQPKSNQTIGNNLGISEGAVRQRKDKLIKLIRSME